MTKQKLRSVLVIWLGLFPTLNAVNFILAPYIANWHGLLKTFITTLIVVPLMVFWVLPALNKIMKKD